MNITKKLSAFIILGMLSAGLFIIPTAQAGDPMIIEPLIMQQEPTLQFEPIPFEPFEPSDPVDPDDPYTEDPNIEINLEFELLEDGRPALRWSRYDGPNFLHYKILHDQDDPNLYYPEFGYIEFYENQNKTGYVWDEPLPVGDNFLRVCVITEDDRRGCSNTISHFMPQAFYENLERERADMAREEAFENRDVDIAAEEEPVRKPQLNDKNNSGILTKLWKFLINNFGIILAILAVIIAASGFTFAAKSKQKSISKYINQIDDTYAEYRMKAKRCEAELYRLHDIIDDQLKQGKLDDSAYGLLLSRIENYMVEIQKQIVNERFGGLPASLKDELFNMMEDGEITENELETIQKLIKRSELTNTDQDSLLQTIKDFKKQDENLKRKKS